MRIGLFGGSFDPPHLGHKKLSRFLMTALSLDRLVISVANVSPFKTDAESAVSDDDRLEMCRLTFDEEGMEVSDDEIARGGVSYSVDVVRHWKETNPGDELFFIVGEDQLTQFHRWRQYEEILSMVTLAAVRRETTTENEALEAYLASHPEVGAHTRLLAYDPMPMSSTEVREAAAEALSLDGLVTPACADYIEKRGLYLKPEFAAMVGDVREKLSDFRFYHSMCVATAAKRLAAACGGDPQKAYIAGILHDVMKEVGQAEALAYLDENGVALTPLERRVNKTLHQMTGALYAEKTYGVAPEIADAIRYHTTGRAGMSLLEKILFVADFISDDRDYSGVEDMRARAKTSLEYTMEEGLRFTIEDLAREDRPIHPDTVAVYNEILLEKLRKEEN